MKKLIFLLLFPAFILAAEVILPQTAYNILNPPKSSDYFIGGNKDPYKGISMDTSRCREAGNRLSLWGADFLYWQQREEHLKQYMIEH